MVTDVLVEYPRAGARRLLERLDGENVGVTTAYWEFSEELGRWQLVLSGPSVRTNGALHVIGQIHKALDEMTEEERQGLSLGDTIVLNPVWREIEAMRRRYHSGSEENDFSRPGFGSREPYIYRIG